MTDFSSNRSRETIWSIMRTRPADAGDRRLCRGHRLFAHGPRSDLGQFDRLCPGPTGSDCRRDRRARLGCHGADVQMRVRCHSHKFDPIPQRDYYRLAATLKGAYDEHDWLKPQLISFGGAVSGGRRALFDLCSRRRASAAKGHAQQSDPRVGKAQDRAPSSDTEKRIKDLVASLPGEPQIFALWDRGEPSPTYIYRRGDYQNAGAQVAAGRPGSAGRARRQLRNRAAAAGAK